MSPRSLIAPIVLQSYIHVSFNVGKYLLLNTKMGLNRDDQLDIHTNHRDLFI